MKKNQRQWSFFLSVWSTFCWIILASSTYVWAQGVPYSKNPTLAVIDGKSITMEDIRNKEIYDAAQQYHQALESYLHQASLIELVKTHKEIQLRPKIEVSDAEIWLLYQQNNLSQRGSLEDFKPQLQQHLQDVKLSQYYTQQYELAVKKGWIKNYLEEPTEMLLVSEAKTSFIRGNAQATVMVLEFSDYQCPYCSRIQGTLDALIQKYKDKVAFAYRHYPLPFHTEADEAAIAAECAGEQGKYGEMHKLLFANQHNQQMEDLKKYARTVQVPNLDKYDQCLAQEKYRNKVMSDIDDGRAVGINGTPGFVIGLYDPKTKIVRGEVVSGAQPPDVFEEKIQKFLNRKS